MAKDHDETKKTGRWWWWDETEAKKGRETKIKLYLKCTAHWRQETDIKMIEVFRT